MRKWNERVKFLIKRVGSPEKLAVQMGVSYLTIMRWAKGSHVPSPLAQRAIEGLERRVK